MSELRRRLMMRPASTPLGPILPPEYQQVEWLGTPDSWGQESGPFIALPYDGYSFVNYMKIDFNYVRYWGCGKLYSSAHLTFAIEPGTIWFKNVAVATFDNSRRNTIIIENSNILVNGVVVATIDTSSISLINFRAFGIFRARGQTGYWRGSIRNLFEFEIQNDMYHYHLIPCYRKADNVAGMYDIVSDVFYTNAGSDSFLVGPDVN